MSEVNKIILMKRKNLERFPDWKNIKENTLRSYCKNIDKKYILIEITGQNNIQPIDLRRERILWQKKCY